MAKAGEMNENLYKEVTDSLKLVSDITSRIDERMKILIESHNETKDKIDELFIQHNSLITRISLLESRSNGREIGEIKTDFKQLENRLDTVAVKVVDLEKEMLGHSNRWANVVDFIFKVSVIVLGGFILWKLGIKN